MRARPSPGRALPVTGREHEPPGAAVDDASDAARQLWENVVPTFRDVESERRWVQLAEDGLHALAKQTSTSKHPDGAVQ